MSLIILYLVVISFVKYVSQSLDRIAGGIPVHKGQFEFFVQLRANVSLNEKTSGTLFCGGTLVHPKWILTAAHCFTKPFLIPLVTFENDYVQALMGSVERAISINSPNFTVRPIKKPYLHPEYGYNNSLNDVAVAVLKEPFSINDYIKTIMLPDPTTNLCSEGVVMGTGRIVFQKKYSEVVLYARVHPKTLDQLSSQIKMPKPTVFYTEVNWFEGHPMRGDSGGPFICFYNSGPPIQYGVMSTNLNSSINSTITTYESVDKFMEFITSHVPLYFLYKKWRVKDKSNRGLRNAQLPSSLIKKSYLFNILFIVITYLYIV